MLDIDSILGPHGCLSGLLKGFNPRPQQAEMAREVEDAINTNSVLIAEAGTGTGKTFAYLAPALLAGKKIIISTGTKTLQDQLYHRDLPFVSDAIGVPVRASLLKGRSNYLCTYRLDKYYTEGRFKSGEQAAHIQKIKQWSKHTQKGDLAEISDIPENSPAWSTVTSTTDNCLGSDCPDAEKCFVTKARLEAHMAEIVVCNHHLFFADMALQAEGIDDLLPRVHAIIFDEAHQLPDIATNFLGINVSTGQIRDLIRDTLDAVGNEAHDTKTEIELFLAKLEKQNARLQDLFIALPDRGAWNEFQHDTKIMETISVWREHIASLCGHLETLSVRGVELNNCFNRCETLLIRLEQLIALEPGYVHWYQRTKNTLMLFGTPLEIANAFQERMNRTEQAWIFTSATLSVNGTFEYFKKRLGIGNAKTRIWPSPFDYEKQCLAFLPQDMPEPNSPAYTQEVVKRALPVLHATNGRAFMLFTSHRALLDAAALLKNSGFPLFIQGDKPKRQLLDQFVESGNGILLGTASFWEGVDVRGEALSCVVIDKLPFASPGDPIVAARIADMREKGLNAFADFQLPQAAITLKQGFGRLIRDENDRGILMLCDPRLLGKSYGKIFLNSLPRVPKTKYIQKVELFMQAEHA